MASNQGKQQVYTMEEILLHQDTASLWIAMYGNVYDITNYQDHHPGGAKLLLNVAGTDATSAFEDVGHSDDAREALKQFLIGKLPEEAQPVARPLLKFKRVIALEAVKEVSTLRSINFNARDIANKALAIACVLALAKLLSPALVSFDSLSSMIDSVPSFWQGVTLSSIVGGACFWTIGYQFNKTITMTRSYRNYPPVMRPQIRIVGPPKRTQPLKAGPLNPRRYAPLTLVERIRVSPDGYKFVFRLPDPTDTLGVPAGQHVQIQADINGAVITRSYTPTSSPDRLGHIELTIKVYPTGNMGNYLLNLTLHSTVNFRGPIGTYKTYHRFLCNHIAMIAGGSGITPMLQLINTICQNPADETTVTLMYVNHSQHDILLRTELDGLARSFPAKFRVHYFLTSSETARVDPTWDGERGRITRAKMVQLLPRVDEGSKFLVCGPDGMVQQVVKDLKSMGCETPKAPGDPTDQVFIF